MVVSANPERGQHVFDMPTIHSTAGALVTVEPVAQPAERAEVVTTAFDLDDVCVTYGSTVAVKGVSLPIREREITALIGPSGCGKSTLLRCLNRMNDLIPGAKMHGSISFFGEDLYARDVDPVDVRRRIGMVFQKPNPFPKSIRENVEFGMRVNGIKPTADRVEAALTAAALWDEVKDRLGKDALALSGGQQQRLCIARAVAVEPEVILMDEPCSALDPIATLAIENLMRELRDRFTIVIVTHNMQQAARVSDNTAFLTVDVRDDGQRNGILAEWGPTMDLFRAPKDPRTSDYITGRFG